MSVATPAACQWAVFNARANANNRTWIDFVTSATATKAYTAVAANAAPPGIVVQSL